jgi:hypothetical protein
VRLELTDFYGASPITGTVTITPSWTVTFTSQDTTLYEEDCSLDSLLNFQQGCNDTTLQTYINQGSGRIMVDSPTANVICTAQVLDPGDVEDPNPPPPSYVVNLDLFKP